MWLWKVALPPPFLSPHPFTRLIVSFFKNVRHSMNRGGHPPLLHSQNILHSGGNNTRSFVNGRTQSFRVAAKASYSCSPEREKIRHHRSHYTNEQAAAEIGFITGTFVKWSCMAKRSSASTCGMMRWHASWCALAQFFMYALRYSMVWTENASRKNAGMWIQL